MPELPEVETVRAGLLHLLGPQPVIKRLRCHRPDLRFPIPSQLAKRCSGRRILGIDRRSKYLLWRLDPDLIMLNHLGMTGSWRLAAGKEGPHDHIEMQLTDGRTLIYRDPRRFGYVDLLAEAERDTHKLLRDLGPEPLDTEHFTADWLVSRCRGRKAPIKNLIMDAKHVVGVGNIYAVESLFRAGIRPTRAAGRISRARLTVLVDCIRTILQEAIAAGGSTIKDFRQAGGSDGYFQHNFQVYGREGEACRSCGTEITGCQLGGRATTWCARCQQ